MAVQGLCCFERALCSCSKQQLLFVAVRRLTVVASLSFLIQDFIKDFTAACKFCRLHKRMRFKEVAMLPCLTCSGHCGGFSCCGALGSRHLDSVVVACGL